DSAKAKEEFLKKKKADEEKLKEQGNDKKDEKKADKKDLPTGQAGEKKDENYKPSEIRIKVTVQKDIPQGKVLLQNARIISMKGDEVIELGDVLIENSRIKQVGAAGSISVD